MGTVLRNPTQWEEDRDKHVYKKAPLANGETITLKFPKTVQVPQDYFTRASDIPVTPGTPEISASFDKYWASLSNSTKALVVEKALKQQYKLSKEALARGFLHSVANTALWNFGDDIGSAIQSVITEKERSEILKQMQQDQAMYNTFAPAASNISRGIGYVTDPAIALAGINAVRTGNPAALGGAVAARRAVSAPLSSVLNPAELVSQRALPQITEAGAKTALDLYGRALGEGYADTDALRSGAEIGSGIQTVFRALPPVARAAFNANNPMTASEATKAARERIIGTLYQDAAGGSKVKAALMSGNVDPLSAARQAQINAEAGLQISDPRSLASISGRNLEDVQAQATKMEPVSGQSSADAAQQRAAGIEQRIEESLRSTGNVPFYGTSNLDPIPTAQQSIDLRSGRVDATGARLRERAYGGERVATNEHRVLTALREWEPWRDIYSTVRTERAAKVLGAGKNKLPAVDGEGVPTLLPQRFDDYLDGKRLIPSSTFSDQVARAGGEANLPYVRLRDADNNLLKENGRYVVQLKRQADFRTLHDLRMGLDSEEIKSRFAANALDAQRTRIDNVIKTSSALRKHDRDYHLLKRWEDAREAAIASTGRAENMLPSDASNLYRINRNTNTPRVKSERRLFRQSMIDEIRRGKYTPKELMDAGLGTKIRMIFDGLPNAQQAYDEFMSSLPKERSVERTAARIGPETKTGPLEERKRFATKTLSLLAKIPAYAFSLAFGMQREFTDSWRRLFKNQTKEEAAELNRLLDPSIVPGTQEFKNLIDELDIMYLKIRQPEKAATIRNVGAMIDAAVVAEHEFYSPVVPALREESEIRREMESSGYQTPVYPYPVTRTVRDLSGGAASVLKGVGSILDSFDIKKRPKAPLE
jgi:hypothetical protein